MSVPTDSRINQILQLGQKNGLLSVQWLTGRGYSSQLLKRYRISGQLTPPRRGVVYCTENNLSTHGALQSFNEQLGEKFRIAAHSVLELWGFNHYMSVGKPLPVITATNEGVSQQMRLNVFDRDFYLFRTDAFI